jgi:hypothetical protein
MNNRSGFILGAAMTASIVSASFTTLLPANAAQGPSSSQTPYLTGVKPGVDFTSILTTGDAAPNGYRMSGIPDGLGAYDNGNGTFTVLMNHEIGNTSGVQRSHGSIGAFISEWVIDKTTLKVNYGGDLIKNAYKQDLATTFWSTAAIAFNRFCSGDLPSVSAFYNSATGKGTQSRIFMTGEENGNGWGVATVAAGTEKGNAYLLPWAAPAFIPGTTTASAGASGWENFLANPFSGDKTIVIGNADGGNNGLTVYVGNKTNTGNDVEKAGLVGGKTYRISVNGQTTESNTAADAGLGLVNGKGKFSLVEGRDNAQGTRFLRPEDGAWDPTNPLVYYFVTTDSYNAAKDGLTGTAGKTRLWRLDFSNLDNPESGGMIEQVIDDNHPGQMFDNIRVDASGKILLQEDVGNNAHNGKIYEYDPATKRLVLVAQHDVNRFGDLGIPANAAFTIDEESSGVIDVTALLGRNDGKKYDLLVVQNHRASSEAALVEGGQLLLMSQSQAIPTPALLPGLLLMGGRFLRRRSRSEQAQED